VDTSDRVVSKNNTVTLLSGFDHDSPLTLRGTRLSPAGAEFLLRVHECGVLVHRGDDWNFRQVVSPFWRIYHNAKPGCAVIVHGRRTALGPTRAVIIPERVPFDCVSREGVPHLWIHFSLNFAGARVAEAPLVLTLDIALQTSFSTLRRSISTSSPRAMLSNLSLGILHLCLARLTEDLQPKPLSPRLYALLEFIDPMLGSSLTNDSLASRVNLNTDAFVRWFRTETGLTPAVYIAGRRIREACRRLAFTDASIEEIADLVGFADRHHFSRVFKTHLGCGPAAFRKRPAQRAGGKFAPFPR